MVRPFLKLDELAIVTGEHSSSKLWCLLDSVKGIATSSVLSFSPYLPRLIYRVEKKRQAQSLRASMSLKKVELRDVVVGWRGSSSIQWV